MGGLMPKGLNIVELDKVHLGDEPDYLNLYPHEFYCYVHRKNDNSKEESFGPVLKWCVLNATQRWTHMYITQCSHNNPLTDAEKNELDNDNPDLEWWLGYSGIGEYVEVLKVAFQSEKDATHFKLVWG